jgi:hypothetical protein
LFGTVFAAAMAVGVGAQQTGTSQANDQSGNGRTVTVTGCLQSGSDMGGGAMTGSTAGTTGSTASTAGTSGSATGTTASNPSSSDMTGSSKYVLTNAAVSSGASGAETATGTSGSTADTSMSGTKTFDLKASSDKEDTWSKYVNHKVQVRGTLDENGGQSAYSGSSAGSTAGTTGSTAGQTASGAQSNASAGSIHVDSITDLGSCSSR